MNRPGIRYETKEKRVGPGVDVILKRGNLKWVMHVDGTEEEWKAYRIRAL
jgi:hypothetical protein